MAQYVSTNTGVPQGSVLAPLPLTIHIGPAIKNCQYHIFSNDTVLYLNGENISKIKSTENTNRSLFLLRNNTEDAKDTPKLNVLH